MDVVVAVPRELMMVSDTRYTSSSARAATASQVLPSVFDPGHGYIVDCAGDVEGVTWEADG